MAVVVLAVDLVAKAPADAAAAVAVEVVVEAGGDGGGGGSSGGCCCGGGYDNIQGTRTHFVSKYEFFQSYEETDLS